MYHVPPPSILSQALLGNTLRLIMHVFEYRRISKRHDIVQA
jgi:hypothetical protein